MDCKRYLIATLDDVMIWQPAPTTERRGRHAGEGSWMSQ
jgi:hypothetical protein